MSKSQHKESNSFHITVSSKELQDIGELALYYTQHKSVLNYIVTVEKGTTGHLHLDSFVELSQTKRQDKFREQVIKALYSHLPKQEHRNIKCVVNYLDPNPMYAIGYALKEEPDQVQTSYEYTYLEKCKEYYRSNVDKVLMMKEQAKEKFKGRTLTLDIVADEYLTYCVKSGYHTMYYLTVQEFFSSKNLHKDLAFKTFMQIYDEYIPFSLYQKINLDKLTEWCDAYLQKRAHSLDCAPTITTP